MPSLILLLHFLGPLFQLCREYGDRRGHQEILLQSWNQKYTGMTAVRLSHPGSHRVKASSLRSVMLQQFDLVLKVFVH